MTNTAYVTSVSETIRKPPLVKAQSVLKKQKIKYSEKRFSIWRMELLHPAMWHDHDIDFARWLLSFWENRVFAFRRQDPRWRRSAILDFRGPIMGSLKSPCTTSYRSSIDIIALNFLVFEKNRVYFAFWRQRDKQTDEQMNSTDALSRSRWAAA